MPPKVHRESECGVWVQGCGGVGAGGVPPHGTLLARTLAKRVLPHDDSAAVVPQRSCKELGAAGRATVYENHDGVTRWNQRRDLGRRIRRYEQALE